MAASVVQNVPVKRSRSTQNNAGGAKQRRYYHHRHQIKHRQEIDSNAATVVSNEGIVSQQLERAIELVLKAIGFTHASPDALSSFRSCVEEYMTRFLEQVRISMLSARRSQPIPHDFITALHHNHLTLDSLICHLDPPVPATKSQIPLLAEDSGQEASVQEAQVIQQLLSQTTLSSGLHMPSYFPQLPSRHTFKSEAVFSVPDKDQKEIRELATEEGRLGEEALRRLMSKKASGDNTLLTGLRSGSKLSLRQRSRSLWRKTYEEAVRKSRPDAMEMDGDDESMHLGPAVNADNMYWRKPIARKITEIMPANP